MRHVFLLKAAALLGLAATTATAALAQSFESKLIRILVPAASTTPPDIISRIIANELSSREGWRVIVENRPGAGGVVAGNDVLRQPADGTLIFAVFLPNVAAPAIMNVPYRLEVDFAPLIKVSVSYNALVVNPSFPAHSVSELAALLKRQPDKYNFSSGGYGTPAHLIGELFKLQAGVHATHVPYQQFPQAISDLLNGTNDYMFITMLPVVDLINAGKLRALATTGPRRVPALKDIPTIVEAGFPQLVVEDWVGFTVKAGTPTETVKLLNRAINRAIASSKVQESFARIGAEPAGGTSEEFGELLRSQLVHWQNVVTAAGIKIQP
jgi:tripartite-type tricarboxylate transporter receptor subunit TctC